MREQRRGGTKSAAVADMPCRGCLLAAFAGRTRLLAEDAGGVSDAIVASWPRSRRRSRDGLGAPSSGRRPRRRRQQSSPHRIPGRKQFAPASSCIPESTRWSTASDGRRQDLRVAGDGRGRVTAGCAACYPRRETDSTLFECHPALGGFEAWAVYRQAGSCTRTLTRRSFHAAYLREIRTWVHHGATVSRASGVPGRMDVVRRVGGFGR
jgi:hypothetical protein